MSHRSRRIRASKKRKALIQAIEDPFYRRWAQRLNRENKVTCKNHVFYSQAAKHLRGITEPQAWFDPPFLIIPRSAL